MHSHRPLLRCTPPPPPPGSFVSSPALVEGHLESRLHFPRGTRGRGPGASVLSEALRKPSSPKKKKIYWL